MLFMVPSSNELNQIIVANAEKSEVWRQFKEKSLGCDIEVNIHVLLTDNTFSVTVWAFKENEVVSFIFSKYVSEETASVRTVLWNESLWSNVE